MTETAGTYGVRSFSTSLCTTGHVLLRLLFRAVYALTCAMLRTAYLHPPSLARALLNKYLGHPTQELQLPRNLRLVRRWIVTLQEEHSYSALLPVADEVSSQRTWPRFLHLKLFYPRDDWQPQSELCVLSNRGEV